MHNEDISAAGTTQAFAHLSFEAKICNLNIANIGPISLRL